MAMDRVRRDSTMSIILATASASPRLPCLGTADLADIGSGSGVERHVLRFEGSNPHTSIRKDSAKAGRNDAFADMGIPFPGSSRRALSQIILHVTDMEILERFITTDACEL